MFVTEFRFLTEVKDKYGRQLWKVSGENGKPHALTGISGVPTNFPTDSLNFNVKINFKVIMRITWRKNLMTWKITYD